VRCLIRYLRRHIRYTVRRTSFAAPTLLLVWLLALVADSFCERGDHTRETNQARGSTPSDVASALLRTSIRGCQYRLDQLTAVVGEAVMDSFYGPGHVRRVPWDSQVLPADDLPGRGRDRTVVRFDLSKTAHRVEAQSVYFGGGNPFFGIDTTRDPKDIGELYMLRGVTEDSTAYRFSRERGYPIAWYHPTDGPQSGFVRDLPSTWLGLNKGLGRPFAEELESNAREGATWTSDTAAPNGSERLTLTFWGKNAQSGELWRVRYWLLPTNDCAVGRAETLGWDAGTGFSVRYVWEWTDFRRVLGLASALPHRHQSLSFVYNSKDKRHGLEEIREVRITRLATGASQGTARLCDQLFPVGAWLKSPSSTEWGARELDPDYRKAMDESTAVWQVNTLWATTPWEQIAPKFPEEWRKGLTAEEIADLKAHLSSPAAATAPKSDAKDAAAEAGR